MLTLRPSSPTAFTGRPVYVFVTALRTDGTEATGEVLLNASAGAFDATPLPLVNGGARTIWRCPATESACTGTATLQATWEGTTAITQVRLLEPVHPGGPDDLDGGAADGGNADGGSTDEPALADAGFGCEDWDGGVHPGYTDELGQPLALGCFGEPIDYVPIASISATATHVCGTVDLTEPVTSPVILHGRFSGHLVFRESFTQCCARPRCLRDPKRITYRFDVDEMTGVLGLGVKWNARTESQFGFFQGSVTAPITNPANATPLEVIQGTGLMTDVNFGIGRAWRP